MKNLLIFLSMIFCASDSFAAERIEILKLLQQSEYQKVENDIRALPQADRNKALLLLSESISNMPANNAAQLTKAVLKGGASFAEIEYSGQSVGIYNFLSPNLNPEIFKAVIEVTKNPDPMIFLGGCKLVGEVFPDIKGKATDGCEGPQGTPLMLMAYRGDLEMVKYLLNIGADKKKQITVYFVNGPMREKEMKAIDFARLKKHNDIVKLLEEKK